MIRATLRALAAASCLLAPLPASATSREIPACPLLAAAEVAAAFGQPLAAAERPAMGGGEGRGRMTTCLWTPEGGRLGPTLSLIVWSWPDDAAAARYVEGFRMAAGADSGLPPPEPLPLGEEALWDGAALHLRQGAVTASLATSLNALDDTPDARRKLAGLAAIVAGRL